MTKNIFDIDSDDIPRTEKLLQLIEEYGKPVTIQQLRTFYFRKHREDIDSNAASSYTHHLLNQNKIKKIKRGIYAPVNYISISKG